MECDMKRVKLEKIYVWEMSSRIGQHTEGKNNMLYIDR